jgi:hypothetical protein
MPLRLPELALHTERPTWITAGMIRLGLLSAFVVAVGMIPLRLTPDDAWIVVGIGGAIAAASLAVLLGTTRALGRRLKLRWAGDAFLLVLRRTGLPLLGLAFFLGWTVVYVALWAVHPLEAFRGLSPRPRFADFFYYAVSTAFVSPPGDVLAHSRGARSATMIEMLTAFALLTTYLAAFVDWHRSEPASVREDLG